MALSKCTETYSEALDAERFYSKHRNSDEFRQLQAKKQLKREHPVNSFDSDDADFIDVNDMINKIDTGDVKNTTNYSVLYIIQNVLRI